MPRPLDHDPADDADRGRPRRAVGGARRVDRVRVGDRRCPGGRRLPGRDVADRPRRRVVVAPGRFRRDGRPQAAYDDPPALGATGPQGAGGALAGIAGRDRATVVFLALHGPFGEDGTVQAPAARPPASRTRGRASPRRRRHGQGPVQAPRPGARDPGRRLDRGPRRAWARDRDAVLGTLEAFAAGTGDPRLMVKPSRLGSSVGMMLAHDPGERGPALDLAFRYDDVALAERYLAGARDLEVSVLGNEPAEIEVFGPGEIMPGHEFYDYQAKYMPGLSETTPTADVDGDPAGRDPQARPRHVPGDRRRGVRAGGLPARGRGARRVRDQHDPGVHADQPVPGPVRGGRLRLRRRVPAGRRPRAGPRPGSTGGASRSADLPR